MMDEVARTRRTVTFYAVVVALYAAVATLYFIEGKWVVASIWTVGAGVWLFLVWLQAGLLGKWAQIAERQRRR